MTPEDLTVQMQRVVDGTHPGQKAWGSPTWRSDPEIAHPIADTLMVATLRALGYGVAMDIYEAQRRWFA